MARYDMTGIGINIREVQDDNGGVKLKVLGLILDGPAHAAGVRQVGNDMHGELQKALCDTLVSTLALSVNTLHS
ncbi:Carboxyl-terminal-processing peptidase 1, chloroplastic [Vitis vinifera]|uniref:Carboxyl-terminal-processing peptidase 1, chloroplastic n=1 Tax=Vitis vinifera TaxID=29760 RepID=A0A438EHY2_VITVI|nr:Carboxyl-terminal-processing peptidase 1, chloroplastic [Vitis vinifera]